MGWSVFYIETLKVSAYLYCIKESIGSWGNWWKLASEKMIIVILAIRRILKFFFCRSYLFALTITIMVSAYEFVMLCPIKMKTVKIMWSEKN